MSYFDPTLIMFMVYIVAMVLIGLFATVLQATSLIIFLVVVV